MTDCGHCKIIGVDISFIGIILSPHSEPSFSPTRTVFTRVSACLLVMRRKHRYTATSADVRTAAFVTASVNSSNALFTPPDQIRQNCFVAFGLVV